MKNSILEAVAAWANSPPVVEDDEESEALRGDPQDRAASLFQHFSCKGCSLSRI